MLAILLTSSVVNDHPSNVRFLGTSCGILLLLAVVLGVIPSRATKVTLYSTLPGEGTDRMLSLLSANLCLRQRSLCYGLLLISIISPAHLFLTGIILLSRTVQRISNYSAISPYLLDSIPTTMQAAANAAELNQELTPL